MQKAYQRSSDRILKNGDGSDPEQIIPGFDEYHCVTDKTRLTFPQSKPC